MAAVKAVGPGGFLQPEPGVSVLKLGGGRWKPTGHDGVTVKTLHVDRETRMLTSILRLEPGSRYPSHRHLGTEQCLVLSGDVRQGENPVMHLFAGDYEKAEPGTLHGDITSETGCELLIISCLDDEYASA